MYRPYIYILEYLRLARERAHICLSTRTIQTCLNVLIQMGFDLNAYTKKRANMFLCGTFEKKPARQYIPINLIVQDDLSFYLCMRAGQEEKY